jgi:co-chaperonin GroES (HSP10)
MISPTQIIVKFDKVLNDELDFNGGKLYLDPTYRPEHNAFPYGTVVNPPKRNPFLMEEDFHYNVQSGDRLYVNYGVLMDLNNCIEHDGQQYWMVDYYMALAVVRDGNIIPVGNHVLIEPMEEEVTSSLIIPEMSRKKIVTRGKVFASNDPQIPVGKIVSFEERGMFENEIEGKKLFVMYNSNILCVHE